MPTTPKYYWLGIDYTTVLQKSLGTCASSVPWQQREAAASWALRAGADLKDTVKELSLYSQYL